MSQQAGWYDDPQNADNLRYWDGVQWTEHTSPKQKPGLDQAGQAAQAAGGWGAAPGQAEAGASAGYGQSSAPGGYGQEPANPYAGGTQAPYEGQWNAMPGGQTLQGVDLSATPDGQPLAGWFQRVLARILDGIIIAVVGAVVANLLVPGVWGDYMDWAMETSTDLTANPPAELMGRLSAWALVITAVGLIYEIVMVKLVGGTLGKLALGLRVRLRDEAGKVGWGTSVLRALVYQLSGVVTPLYLLNVLWPLWDQKRQALHDKPARTNVVRVRR